MVVIIFGSFKIKGVFDANGDTAEILGCKEKPV